MNSKNLAAIKKGLAVILLSILALAVAPKQLLHDALTTHQHHFSKPSQQSHVNTYNFICDCENLVAESAFVDLTDRFSFSIRADYAAFIPHFSHFFDLADLESFRLRGPPSNL